MALIEHDQPDVVDQGWVAPQGEVEFLRRRNYDLAGTEGIFVAGRKPAGAVER